MVANELLRGREKVKMVREAGEKVGITVDTQDNLKRMRR